MNPDELDNIPVVDPSETEETPEMETPEMETPEMETPEMETPEMETPEMETPEMETPEMETPEMETPEMETPEMETPEESESDITATISADVESLPEGDEGETSLITYTVTLSEPIPDQDVRGIIRFDSEGEVTFDDGADDGLDIPAGQQTGTFTYEVIGDNVEEENETITPIVDFIGLMSDGSGDGRNETFNIAEPIPSVTIVDDDGTDTEEPSDITATITADVESLPEGDEGETSLITYTVTLSEPIPDQDVRGIIRFDSDGEVTFDDGADDGLDIPAGQQTGTFTYEVIGDNVEEENETITPIVDFIGLMSDDSGDGRNETFNIAEPIPSVTIVDDDTDDMGDTDNPEITGDGFSISANADVITEGNEGDTTTITYTIDAGQPLEQDARLIIDVTGGGDFDSVTVDLPAGEQTVTITDEVEGDNEAEDTEAYLARIISGNLIDKNGAAGAAVNISDNDTAIVYVSDDDGGNDIVYRFFNPAAGVHFYTANEDERQIVQDTLDNYTFEGASYRTVDPLTGGAEDVYRFFNSSTGVHLYTTDENERDFIQDNLDEFAFEGTAFNAFETEVEGSIPIYRFFEPTIGVHFYTPNEGERDFVENELDNYNNEGIAYYALPLNGDTI